MTVKIENANPKVSGVWGVAPGTVIFTAAGTDFTVFTKTGATGFVNQPFKPVDNGGTVTGVVTLYNGNPQLAPQSLDDVAAFKSTDPTIVSANPKSIDFPNEGGAEDIEVTVVNSGDKTLQINGLSNPLSAKIEGTKITVTAAANPKNSVESQTLKISIEGNKKLTKVTLTSHTGAAKATKVGITDTNNNIVKGGEAIAKDENHVFTYNLSGTIIDTKYRIYIASDANAQLGGWTLVYE